METRVVTNRSAPAATIVPILIYEDVGQAIDWLCRAFGFTERLRAERDGVIGHAQLAVAEGAIMLGRQGGPFRAPHGEEVTAYVHVAVDDLDRRGILSFKRTIIPFSKKLIIPSGMTRCRRCCPTKKPCRRRGSIAG